MGDTRYFGGCGPIPDAKENSNPSRRWDTLACSCCHDCNTTLTCAFLETLIIMFSLMDALVKGLSDRRREDWAVPMLLLVVQLGRKRCLSTGNTPMTMPYRPGVTIYLARYMAWVGRKECRCAEGEDFE